MKVIADLVENQMRAQNEKIEHVIQNCYTAIDTYHQKAVENQTSNTSYNLLPNRSSDLDDKPYSNLGFHE